MDPTKLEELGFSRNEALTYITLLELGETKTGPIVKKTGLHRVLIYDALAALIRKGLVSFVIKENIKYFQAADPARLVDFLEEKKNLAEGLLPELSIIQKDATFKQMVAVYEGIKGVKSALSNMLKELEDTTDHYVFASGNMADMLGSYYQMYQKIKQKKKIRTSILYDESFRNREEIIRQTYGSIRYYPITQFPSDTWIYNDKVLIVTYTAKPPIAVLIISSETAESYKKLFNGFWIKAKK